MLGGCARDPGGSASGTTPFFLHYSQKTAFNLLVWTPVLQKSVLHLLLLFRLCPTTPAWIPLLLDRPCYYISTQRILGLDSAFPGLSWVTPGASTPIIDGGRALPPREGGIQPGLPPAASSPGVDTAFLLMCVTIPVAASSHSGVEPAFPEVCLATPVAPKSVVDGERVLPPREGGVQPGLLPSSSSPVVDPTFPSMCVTTPVASSSPPGHTGVGPAFREVCLATPVASSPFTSGLPP